MKVFVVNFLIELIAGVFYTCAVINWSFLVGDGSSDLSSAAIGWAMFFLAMGLFEVPTGYIADRFGHKFSTLIGAGSLSLAVLGMGFAPSQIILYILAFAAGIALTLISGAKTAWLYSLRYHYGSGLTGPAYLLRLELARRGALVVAALLGGWLTLVSPSTIWFVAAASGLMALSLAQGLPQATEASETADAKVMPRKALSPLSQLRLLASFLALSFGSHNSEKANLAGQGKGSLALFYCASAVFALGFGVHDILLQPHVLRLAHQQQSIALGIVFGGMHAAAFLAGLLYSRYGSYYQESKSTSASAAHSSKNGLVGWGLALSCGMLSLGFIAATAAESFWLFVIVWCLSYSAMSWFYPFRSYCILAKAPHHASATFLSFDEALDGLLRATLALVMASFFTDNGSFGGAADRFWYFGATMLLLAGGMYFRAAAEKKSSCPLR